MNIDLILLAGGESSRMGRDKLRLRDAAGQLLVQQWFERLDWPTPPRIVLPVNGSAPNELENWPAAHDAVAGEGPLRGVQAALAATNVGWLIVVAVDTPGIVRTQIDWLLDRRATDPAARLWMLRRAGDIEPFPMLIHRDFSDVIESRLAKGRRSLHGLADEASARVVNAPAEWPASVWRNLNRPADLEAYLATADES